MSDLVSLTIEQARYHVLNFFKLDLSASYAGHAPFWFAFVQNLQSAQQVQCILVLVQQILLRVHETAKVSVRMYANLLVLRLCMHWVFFRKHWRVPS